jgi:hypothetical protein
MNKKINWKITLIVGLVALVILHLPFVNPQDHFKYKDIETQNTPQSTSNPKTRGQSELEKDNDQESAVNNHLDQALGHFGL